MSHTPAPAPMYSCTLGPVFTSWSSPLSDCDPGVGYRDSEVNTGVCLRVSLCWLESGICYLYEVNIYSSGSIIILFVLSGSDYNSFLFSSDHTKVVINIT